MKNVILGIIAVLTLTACSQTTQTFEDLYETYDTEYVSDCLFYEDLVCEFE